MGPWNPILSITGVVCGHHTDPSGLPMFIIRATARDESQNQDEVQVQDEAQGRLSTFHMACAFPATGAIPLASPPTLPEVHSFAHIRGNFVGFYPWGGRQVLGVILRRTSFV